MKLRLLILLAAALAAAPAAGQTIKSLGYNTTNGFVTYSGTNSLTFTNALQFSTNARAATRTNLGGTSVGNLVFTATNAEAAATAIGLGTTNEVTFSRVGVGGVVISTNSFSGGDFAVTAGRALTFISGGVASTTRTNRGLGAQWLTNTDVTNFRAAIGLGATNNVTFNELTATGNVTLSGVNNTATAQTADSASSLMTRDLVETEMGTVRNEINQTYWFGLAGQGGWIGRGSGPLVRQFSAGGLFGFSAGTAVTSSNRIGASARGGMLVMDNEGNAGAVILATNNSCILQARLKRQSYSGEWPTARGAASFQLAPAQFPYETIGSFWGFTTNTIGLFYVPQPTNAWAASTAFTTNDRITVSNVVWAVATSGTTGTNQPVWTDLIDSTVTNGTAVFRNVGPHTSNQWVLARGHTNASGIVMTNTGKTNFAAPAHNVLTLRYDGPAATMFASVRDSTGTSAEVSLPYPPAGRMPAFFGRPDFIPAGGSPFDTAATISYFSIQSQLAP